MKRTALYLTLAVGGVSPFISLSGFAATGVDVLPAGQVQIGGKALHHAPPADRALPQGATITHGAGNVAYGP